jgi:hypothetical protein
MLVVALVGAGVLWMVAKAAAPRQVNNAAAIDSVGTSLISDLRPGNSLRLSPLQSSSPGVPSNVFNAENYTNFDQPVGTGTVLAPPVNVTAPGGFGGFDDMFGKRPIFAYEEGIYT